MCIRDRSIGDEAVASLRLYTEANEKDMRKHGVLTIKEQLNKILERLTSHIENDKLASRREREGAKGHFGHPEKGPRNGQKGFAQQPQAAGLQSPPHEMEKT